MAEQRTHPRYECVVPLGSDWTLIDISEGGCQIEVPCEITVGALCPVVFERVLPEHMNRFNVRVVNMRESTETGRFRLHGCFLPFSDRVRNELRSKLTQLSR